MKTCYSKPVQNRPSLYIGLVKLIERVPNSVVFHYQASASPYDSVFIQFVNVFVNENKVFSAAFKSPPSEIVGVQYRFEGLGAVKETRFYNEASMYEF